MSPESPPPAAAPPAPRGFALIPGVLIAAGLGMTLSGPRTPTREALGRHEGALTAVEFDPGGHVADLRLQGLEAPLQVTDGEQRTTIAALRSDLGQGVVYRAGTDAAGKLYELERVREGRLETLIDYPVQAAATTAERRIKVALGTLALLVGLWLLWTGKREERPLA